MQMTRESLKKILETNPDRTFIGSKLLGGQQRRELLKKFLARISHPVLTKEELFEFIQIVDNIRQQEIDDPTLPKLKTTQQVIALIPAGNPFFDVYRCLVTDKLINPLVKDESIKAKNAELCWMLASLLSLSILTFRSHYTSLKPLLDEASLPEVIATLAIDHKSFAELILYLKSEKLLRPGETLLNAHTLSIVTHHRNELPLLDKLLRKLHDHKCLVVQEQLVYDYLTPLKNCNHLKTLTDLLLLITFPTPILFAACCNHPKLADLLEVSAEIQQKTHTIQPFIKTFPDILELSATRLTYSLKPLIAILHKLPETSPQLLLDSLDIIKSSTPDTVFMNFVNHDLPEFLSLLIKNTLLTKETLASLITDKIHINLQKAWYLHERGCLNQNTLHELSAPYIDVAHLVGICLKIDIAILNQLRSLHEIEKLNDFKEILSQLLRTNKALATQFIPKLLQIKPKYYPQIAKKCSYLAQNKELHEASITHLFDIHQLKLSAPVAKSVTTSEKIWNEETFMTQYQLEKTAFLFDKEPVNKHAFGGIYEGFQADKPDGKWQLKTFDSSNEAKKFARNEAKYGKEVTLISTETMTATLMRMNGVSIKDIKPEDVTSIAFSMRLEIFRNFLLAIARLHEVRREAKSITQENCKLDFTDGKIAMYLGSMGEAQKIKTLFSDSVYPEYKDKYQTCENHLILAREMHPLGIICARFFPEYQDVIAENGGFVPKTKELPQDKLDTPIALEHSIISILVSSMTNDCRSNRPTSSLAADYCDRILAKQDLKQEDLDTIRDATIHKQVCNSVDIIQDRFVISA